MNDYKLKVHVIDDDKLVNRYLFKLITMLGYSCKTFEDPEDGMIAILEDLPNLVFID